MINQMNDNNEEKQEIETLDETPVNDAEIPGGEEDKSYDKMIKEFLAAPDGMEKTVKIVKMELIAASVIILYFIIFLGFLSFKTILFNSLALGLSGYSFWALVNQKEKTWMFLIGTAVSYVLAGSVLAMIIGAGLVYRALKYKAYYNSQK